MKRTGDFQARTLLFLFYFVVLAPFAIVLRVGSDPLGIKGGCSKGWRPRDGGERVPIGRAKTQY